MASAIGEILVEQGTMTAEQLAEAERRQAESGSSFGRTVVEMGLAEESDLVRAAAKQLGMRYVEVTPQTVDQAAVGLVPRDEAADIQAVPIGFGDGGKLVVAITNPTNRRAAERVKQLTGQEVEVVLAPRQQVLEAIRHLSPAASVEALDDEVAAQIEGGKAGVVGAAARKEAARRDAASAATGRAMPRELRDGRKSGTLRHEEESEIDLDALLKDLVESGGSDLHLTAGIHPSIRVLGDIQPLADYPILQPDELQKTLYAIMTQKQREEFENNLELDMSYAVPNLARFRVNVFQQRNAIGSVMRVIPFEIMTLEELGIPSQVGNFAHLPRGFVLVTGPTGSGKSTTLAALIDMVNEQRAAHIMTVEDPIEFLHNHKKSVVNQREIGTDSYSFTAALKHVLRQDPDVILVGELRDLETIQIALTAAETGHLVFGTLHTQDAPQTIDRIIDVFPPHQQEQIRVMLSGALKGVMCQTLLKTADGQGRTVATELMIATTGIKNLIREGKTHQIYSAIQAGASHGMMAMDQSLAKLVKEGKVTYDDALEKCNNVAEFNRLAGRS